MSRPIACTLEPADLGHRRARLAALAARALRSRERTPRGERLTFAPGAATWRELRAVVAAEARCCAFLTMELQATDDGLVLDVSGPPEARPLIEQLFA